MTTRLTGLDLVEGWVGGIVMMTTSLWCLVMGYEGMEGRVKRGERRRGMMLMYREAIK